MLFVQLSQKAQLVLRRAEDNVPLLVVHRSGHAIDAFLCWQPKDAVKLLARRVLPSKRVQLRCNVLFT